MYYVGICDDGENTCSELESMVFFYAEQKSMELKTAVWYTGESLCGYLKKGEPLDVLFLDIELWQMTGIEAGAYIRNRLEDRRLQIVYISGKASYAQSLFKTQPQDFLVKPIRQQQVDEVLDLAVKLLGKNETKFAYQSGRDYYYIPYGEILYFISEGRKIRIVTAQGEKEFYGKIRELEKTLPKDFLKIHQSYLVHTLFVARYAYEEVELTDGTILSISKKYRKQVRERLLRGGEET